MLSLGSFLYSGEYSCKYIVCQILQKVKAIKILTGINVLYIKKLLEIILVISRAFFGSVLL